jgi:hypothetical protein
MDIVTPPESGLVEVGRNFLNFVEVGIKALDAVDSNRADDAKRYAREAIALLHHVERFKKTILYKFRQAMMPDAVR